MDTLNKKKVLIVEDEGDMCLLLNIILTDEDTQLDHVKSLATAATYLQSHRPDLVLLDNKLPDGFGVDFIKIVKKLSPASPFSRKVWTAVCNCSLVKGFVKNRSAPFSTATSLAEGS